MILVGGDSYKFSLHVIIIEVSDLGGWVAILMNSFCRSSLHRRSVK